jgi:hypothetical protein
MVLFSLRLPLRLVRAGAYPVASQSCRRDRDVRDALDRLRQALDQARRQAVETRPDQLG